MLPFARELLQGLTYAAADTKGDPVGAKNFPSGGCHLQSGYAFLALTAAGPTPSHQTAILIAALHPLARRHLERCRGGVAAAHGKVHTASAKSDFAPGLAHGNQARSGRKPPSARHRGHQPRKHRKTDLTAGLTSFAGGDPGGSTRSHETDESIAAATHPAAGIAATN